MVPTKFHCLAHDLCRFHCCCCMASRAHRDLVRGSAASCRHRMCSISVSRNVLHRPGNSSRFSGASQPPFSGVNWLSTLPPPACSSGGGIVEADGSGSGKAPAGPGPGAAGGTPWERGSDSIPWSGLVPVLVRTGSAGLPDAADIEERDFSSSSPRQRRSTRRCQAEPSLYDDMVYLRAVIRASE